MALDHTRDFFFGLSPSPTDLAETTAELFATRWITHVCAPGFLLLAGMSSRLLSQSSGRRHVFGFLLSRGALLIALELTIITFAWIPDPGRGIVLLQVIWAIGWSMILLAALLWIPAGIVGAIAIGVTILPLSDPAALLDTPEWLIVLLFDGGAVLTLGDTDFIVSYAILPWAAVMVFGWWVGGVFVSGDRVRTSACVWTGLALLVVFAALRVRLRCFSRSTWWWPRPILQSEIDQPRGRGAIRPAAAKVRSVAEVGRRIANRRAGEWWISTTWKSRNQVRDHWPALVDQRMLRSAGLIAVEKPVPTERRSTLLSSAAIGTLRRSRPGIAL